MSRFTESDLVIFIPVLRRPHRAALVYESAMRATPGARVLFIVNPEDKAEQEAVRATGADMLNIGEEWRPGDYARKINAAYRATTEPLMFLGADDIVFRPGWFKRAVVNFDRPGCEVVGTNDLGNPRVMRGTHSTHTLVTRKYCDEFGTIDCKEKVLHDGYHHEYVDDEFIETAKYRGAFVAATDSIVEHLHPFWGKAETDPLYDEIRARMRYGFKVYMMRRRKWGL